MMKHFDIAEADLKLYYYQYCNMKLYVPSTDFLELYVNIYGNNLVLTGLLFGKDKYEISRSDTIKAYNMKAYNNVDCQNYY